MREAVAFSLSISETSRHESTRSDYILHSVTSLPSTMTMLETAASSEHVGRLSVAEPNRWLVRCQFLVSLPKVDPTTAYSISTSAFSSFESAAKTSHHSPDPLSPQAHHREKSHKLQRMQWPAIQRNCNCPLESNLQGH